jgi:hypothetical protein
VAPTRPQNRRPASPSHRGRFGRRAGEAQIRRPFRNQQQTAPVRRFRRSPTRPTAGGIARKRRRQPQPGGLQKLVQRFRDALPGASSGKRERRSGSPIAPVRDLFTSIGGKKGAGTSRGRKPAMLHLLGAGAVGAAVAKRRRGSAPAETPATSTETSPNRSRLPHRLPRPTRHRPTTTPAKATRVAARST